MKCKTCGKNHHYCSSCDYDKYMSEDYCDYNCFINSDFYKKEKGTFLALLDRLSEDSIRCLKTIEENRHEILEYHYETWIDEALEKLNENTRKN